MLVPDPSHELACSVRAYGSACCALQVPCRAVLWPPLRCPYLLGRGDSALARTANWTLSTSAGAGGTEDSPGGSADGQDISLPDTPSDYSPAGSMIEHDDGRVLLRLLRAAVTPGYRCPLCLGCRPTLPTDHDRGCPRRAEGANVTAVRATAFSTAQAAPSSTRPARGPESTPRTHQVLALG